MARNTIITVLLAIASLLLAVALFVAGAIWRGKVTSGSLREVGIFASWPTLPSSKLGDWKEQEAFQGGMNNGGRKVRGGDNE